MRSAYEFNPELCIISHHTVHFPKFYQSPFLFAVLFVLVSICSFAALFEIQLKKNVVRPLDQKRGFSSTDNAHLGYSFWILLGAAGVLLLCPLMIMMKNCRCLHYFKKKKHEITTVDGVMLYWQSKFEFILETSYTPYTFSCFGCSKMTSLKELPWLSHKSKNSIFILLFKCTETPLGLRAGMSIVILKIKFYNIVQIVVFAIFFCQSGG